jgi:hypothetical protein
MLQIELLSKVFFVKSSSITYFNLLCGLTLNNLNIWYSVIAE